MTVVEPPLADFFHWLPSRNVHAVLILVIHTFYMYLLLTRHLDLSKGHIVKYRVSMHNCRRFNCIWLILHVISTNRKKHTMFVQVIQKSVWLDSWICMYIVNPMWNHALVQGFHQGPGTSQLLTSCEDNFIHLVWPAIQSKVK